MTQPVIDPAFITRRHDVDSHGRPVPLMDTRELSDILSDLTNRVGGTPNTQAPRDRLRSEWAAIGGSTPREQDPNNDTIWTETVSSGGMWIPEQSKPAAGFVRAPGLGAASTDESRFQLMLFPHIYYDDGRHANLNWAQEMPDPLSSSVWNSWVEINMDVAHSLNIRTGDIVRLQTAGGSIEVPAVPFPGIHPRTIAMPIGQGHTMYGRNASGVGSNPLSILDPVTDPDTGALAFSATTVTLSKVRSAQSGFHSEMNTLVLVQDRPHGEEPAAVKDLIHETAKEWKSGPAKAAAESQRSRPVL